MKTPRFSDLDLARLISIARESYLAASLRTYRKRGGSSWSYAAVRASTGDLLAARTPLHGELVPVSWAKLEHQITGACTHGSKEIASNLEVGKALFDGARRLGWQCAAFPMGRLPIGSGESVRYWCDLVAGDADGGFVPYFDHRKDNGVTDDAVRQVVFSMQHVWLRERNPDLAGMRLGIVRFAADAPRNIEVSFADETDLLSYDELDARVRLVYEAWDKIVRETHVAPARRTGTDDTPDFFEGEDD